MKILYETKQVELGPKKLAQKIKMPSSWFGRLGGSYSLISRDVHVMGTVEVDHFGVERQEYGAVRWSRREVLVIHRDGEYWDAIEYVLDGVRYA